MGLKCTFVGCEKVFSCLSKLQDHMNVHLDIRPYQCEICQKDYPSKKGLDAHRQSHQPSKFDCKDCGKSFIYKRNLVRHIPLCKVVYKCAQCGKEYQKKGCYNAHIREKHPIVVQGQIKCSQCNRAFKSKGSLTVHQRIIHEGVRVKCPGCGKLFSYRSSLTDHRKICEGIKQKDKSIGSEPEKQSLLEE